MVRTGSSTRAAIAYASLVVQPLDLRLRARHPPDEVGERLARVLGRAGVARLLVVGPWHGLDLAGRVVRPVEPLEDLEGLLARHDDVHTAVFESLEHLGHAGRAPDPPRAAVVVA